MKVYLVYDNTMIEEVIIDGIFSTKQKARQRIRKLSYEFGRNCLKHYPKKYIANDIYNSIHS